MANTGSTAETICLTPAREKTFCYLGFLAFLVELQKSFVRNESSLLWLYVAKAAVALMSISSTWALEFFIFLAVTFFLRASLCWCREGMSTETSYCGRLRQSHCLHAMACNAVSTANSLSQVCFLCWGCIKRNSLTTISWGLHRDMQDSAALCSDGL